VIKRIREVARELFIPEGEVLRAILNNVVGIDLNPLAVIAARTNYLLVLGELLRHWKGDHDIPIYLADSVVTPAEGKDLWTVGKYPLYTSVGKFEIPREAVKWERISELASLLEEDVKTGKATDVFLREAKVQLQLKEKEFESAKPHLEVLYEKLRDFEKEQLNGIWARIIKNGFAPLFIGEFDYVVGNPPWVNWENLPQGYRDRSKDLWFRQGLFPHSGMEAILGKGKKDISMLMTYVAMESYLREEGKLGFLITQSVFKTAGAGQGFRRFMLSDSTPIKVIHVDDMVELNPFEGASNRTTVVILQKDFATSYPIPYTYWRKAVKGRSIGFDQNLDEVKKITERKRFYAEPVNPHDKTSPWLTGRPKAMRAVKKILGKSNYEAHEGANTGGANGVYWLNIELVRPDGKVLVTNITEGQKREVKPTQAILEPDLLYPLLRGKDVKRWRARPSAWILMVQDPVKRCGIDEKELQLKYPKTWEYLKKFEGVLRTRAAFNRYFSADDPFYSMFDVGDYTFAPYKVVWQSFGVSRMMAAVCMPFDGEPVMTNQAMHIFISFTRLQEAHYVCAVMNSTPFEFSVISHTQRGGKSFAQSNILETLHIPKFDRRDPVHLKLAELSERAHELAKQESDELGKVERKIDVWAAKIWGLTDDELKEIQLSLKEMVGEE